MEIFEFRISRRFEADMRTLIDLDEKELQKLGHAFASAAPRLLDRREIAKLVDQTVSDRKKREDVLRILFGLAFLVASYPKGIAELRSEIKRGLAESEIGDASKLMNFLEPLLSSKGLFLSAKATSLSSEFGQVYSGSRILTDVRPVFQNDAPGQVAGYFVVHNLKLVVETSEGDKELFVAMSEDGIDSLAKDIERARLKAKQLQGCLKGGVLGERVEDRHDDSGGI